MQHPGFFKTVCLTIALSGAAGAALGNPIGLPGTDYDLASLVDAGSQATYDPGTDTITTTGTKAKLLLPAMPASPPDELRYVEVELTPSVAVTVQANWWNLSPRIFLTSNSVAVAAGAAETIVFNLSTMGATDGTVKLRVKGSAPGTVISRVRLVEVPKPNLVFILVDDLSELELELGFGRSLGAWTPALDTRLQDKGTVFENFFNTTPLCCPSRASYHTGRYAHNHGIYGNNYTVTGGNGGWRRFWELGHDLDSVGVWMQDAGYDTVLIGKFMNGYPDKPGAFVPESYVPAGWDEWYGEFNNDLGLTYHDFRINQNGTVVVVDDGTYMTDYESALAVDYIDRVAPTGQPFFMFLNPYAPHGPTEPAVRHDGTHPDLEPVPPPSFNEADLSDKPQYIQDDASTFGEYFPVGAERKLDMTLAIDELIAAVFDALEAQGVLDRTYVFFASDNGLLRGEHGIGGKSAPYEESVSIPLIVRGPGVPEGVSRPDLVLNIDVAATLLELAGATPPASVDGESIVELMTGATPSRDWRDAVQVELLHEVASTNQPHVVPPYFGIRTSWQCYVEYLPGDLELYDLARDPFQLASDHVLDSAGLLPVLQGPLAALSTCSGQGCRDASRLGWPDASAAFSCNYLDCTFDAAGSSDDDGTVVDHSWDFGDGTSDTGVSVAHSFAAGGDYQVILTVTDNDGSPGLQVLTVTVTEPATHVTQVQMLLKTDNPLNLRAIAKVFVADDLGNDVAGATVEGEWTVNGVPAGGGSALTNSKGRAKLILFDPNPGDLLEFCVTGVTHPDFTYDPASNLQTCNQAVWPGAGPTAHVTQVQMLLKTDNPLNLRVIAKVFVADDLGNDVAEATVDGDWMMNGAPAGSGSALTNSKGRAKLILFDPNPGDLLELCVTDVTHPDFTYDPASNLQTCNQAVWP